MEMLLKGFVDKIDDLSTLDKPAGYLIDAAMQKDPVDDVAVFGQLFRLLGSVDQDLRIALFASLRKQLSSLIGVLYRVSDRKGSCRDGLIELINLLIEDESVVASTAQTDPTADSGESKRRFYSATYPRNRVLFADSVATRDLQNLTQLLESRSVSLESRHLRRKILQKFSAAVPTGGLSENATHLVRTATTEENVRRIEELSDDERPVLLYGETGAGNISDIANNFLISFTLR